MASEMEHNTAESIDNGFLNNPDTGQMPADLDFIVTVKKEEVLDPEIADDKILHMEIRSLREKIKFEEDDIQAFENTVNNIKNVYEDIAFEEEAEQKHAFKNTDNTNRSIDGQDFSTNSSKFTEHIKPEENATVDHGYGLDTNNENEILNHLSWLRPFTEKAEEDDFEKIFHDDENTLTDTETKKITINENKTAIYEDIVGAEPNIFENRNGELTNNAPNDVYLMFKCRVNLENWETRLEKSSRFCKDCKILFSSIHCYDTHNVAYHSVFTAHNDIDNRKIKKENEIVIKNKYPWYRCVVNLENWGPRLETSSCYCKKCKILFSSVDCFDSHNISNHTDITANNNNTTVVGTSHNIGTKPTKENITNTKNSTCVGKDEHNNDTLLGQITLRRKRLFKIKMKNRYVLSENVRYSDQKCSVDAENMDEIYENKSRETIDKNCSVKDLQGITRVACKDSSENYAKSNSDVENTEEISDNDLVKDTDYSDTDYSEPDYSDTDYSEKSSEEEMTASSLKKRRKRRRKNNLDNECTLSESLKSYLDSVSYGRNLFKCITCECCFLKEHACRRHNCSNKNFQKSKCSQCDYEFTLASLPRHIYVHHEKMKLNRTDFLVKQFNLKLFLLNAESQDKGAAYDKCVISDTTMSKYNYGNHLFKCPNCECCFLSVYSYINHNCKMSRVKNEKCKQCGYLFTIFSMRRHVLIHHDRMKLKREDFNFDLTRQTFRNDRYSRKNTKEYKLQLKPTKMVKPPTDEVLYKCDKCSVCQWSLYAAERHVKNKNCPPKFTRKCSICGLVFASKSISTHIVYHHTKFDMKIEDFDIKENPWVDSMPKGKPKKRTKSET